MRRVFREQPAGAESLGERPFGSQRPERQGFVALPSGRQLPSIIAPRPDLQSLARGSRWFLEVPFSWSTDELFNTWYEVRDVTVQWCLFSKALARAPGAAGSHSKGPLLGSKQGARQSFHHNLMVHNAGRNPMIKMRGLADVVNNVAHVPGTVAMSLSDEYGFARANFIGNFVSAPHGDGLVRGCVLLSSGNGFSVFARDNVGPLQRGPANPVDAWEIRRRLDPKAASDAAGDDDHDGSTNLEEFLNGT